MASRTATCTWCGTSFPGTGETGADAQKDADSTVAHHAMTCPSNPANQE